jgi:anti-sigma regulatory factor (Ser/Thr protein kinase)/GNAT superfamily N-acetyltransferase
MDICGKRFVIEVPNDAVSTSVVSNFVGDIARITGFDDSGRIEIQDAVAEAANNVIFHAFVPGEKTSFEIICEPVSLGLKVIVKEMGMPLDISHLPECPLSVSDEDSPESGHGICKIKRMVDEVSFYNMGKGGKELHLFKYLDNTAIGSCMTASESEDVRKGKRLVELPESSVLYTVRRLEAGEEIEVSKCAYAAYHYTYFYDYIYYPERIRKLNETGELISFIAVTDEGEVMGHAALKGDTREWGVPELAAAFVKPKYRGQGCLNALAEALLKEAGQRSFSGLYVRAVTSHNYSQKNALKYGFRDCCLFLALLDPLEFAEIPVEKTQRESMLYSFKYLASPGEFAIYPPSQHAKMVLSLYNNLGAHPELREQPAVPHHVESSIYVTIDPNHTGKIEVLQYGEDVVSEVNKHLRTLCVNRIEAIYLFLNLRDPLTSHVTSKFENMGFFFAGINPTSGTDFLVLQFLNNFRLDYGRLRFASETARELAEYIRLRDPI